MSKALDSLYETLDVFSGKKAPCKEVDETYERQKSFYSGNGNPIDANSIEGLAEHIRGLSGRSVRNAFIDILEGLEMSDSDRAYYKWMAGAEE
jgi:hypothetical protein